jgi:hypothetical protein
MNASTLEQARKAKVKMASRLIVLGDSGGVGITRIDGGYGLKVNLSQPPSEANTLPVEIDGVPVRFEVVGEIRKQAAGV